MSSSTSHNHNHKRHHLHHRNIASNLMWEAQKGKILVWSGKWAGKNGKTYSLLFSNYFVIPGNIPFIEFFCRSVFYINLYKTNNIPQFHLIVCLLEYLTDVQASPYLCDYICYHCNHLVFIDIAFFATIAIAYPGRAILSISSLLPGPAHTLWLPLRPDDSHTTEVQFDVDADHEDDGDGDSHATWWWQWCPLGPPSENILSSHVASHRSRESSLISQQRKPRVSFCSKIIALCL